MPKQITVYQVESYDHQFDTAISLEGDKVRVDRGAGVKIGDIVEISDAGATSVIPAPENDTTEAPKTLKTRILGSGRKAKK